MLDGQKMLEGDTDKDDGEETREVYTDPPVRRRWNLLRSGFDED